MGTFAWIAWPAAPVLGPLTTLGRRPWSGSLALLLVILLTAVTQIGGLLLWVSWPLLRIAHARFAGRSRWLRMAAPAAVFLMIYAVASFVAVPPLASALGRDRLPCFAAEVRPLQAVSPLFCLTNRNYARPPVHRLLDDLSTAMAREAPGTVTGYLDAGFPFLDGFPMLPHLSHRTGQDVDLAFFYRHRADNAQRPAAGAWPVGYWVYAQPKPGEAWPCASRFTDLRWDFDWLQPVFSGVVLDEPRTGAMMYWLTTHGRRYGLQKILLEPHLQQRLETDPALTRFQGCRAARHDDHIHLQIR